MSVSSQPELSIVVPVYNEAESLFQLHQEITAIRDQLDFTTELIYIDDGSQDGSDQILTTFSDTEVIKLRRNSGQTHALQVGIKQAQGELIATLDSDLQNDPADIPKLLAHLNATGADMVCGWRKNRHDSWSKKFVSDGAKWLRSFIIKDGVHDAGCTLRLAKAEVYQDVYLRGEMHRFIPALVKWQGFSVTELPVNHRFRQHGQSKYSWRRIIKGFVDMISLWFFNKYESRPLHLLGGGGLLAIGLGTMLLIYLGVGRLLGWFALANSIWPLMAVFIILFGVQLFVSGLVMDLVLRRVTLIK